MSEDQLEIVDQSGAIIGLAHRSEVHAKGFLHKEIHVYFLTPNKELIFQHRSKDKDTLPDLLDSTVGGHVDPGESFEEAAVRETFEETGISVQLGDLIEVAQKEIHFKDEVTGKINNAIQKEYLYHFQGTADDLRLEAGKAIDFETMSLEQIRRLTESEKTRFIPYILDFVLKYVITDNL